MLINLISQSNYQSYNVFIAKTLGLNTAVYLNALIEINEKAMRKEKLVDEHFTIDRKYITDRTTLTVTQQKNIEKTLETIQVIHKNNDDCIKVNIDVLAGIMMGKEESVVKDLSFLKQAKQSNADVKKQSILKSVKMNINQAYPDDMKQAYSEWLDVVQNKFGFVSKQMILTAQSVVDHEANHDVDKAIDIIHIASANGWKDMNYAVKVYNERNKTRLSQVMKNNINVSGELF